MSIKLLSLIFSGLAAIALGWFSVDRYVAAYGWKDPVAVWFFISLAVWLILAFGLQYLAHWFDPLRQIESTGTLLYRDDGGKVSYLGLYFDEASSKTPFPLSSKFRLRDLFRRYTFFPLIMKFDLESYFPISPEATYHLVVEGFQINLFFSGEGEDKEEKAMEIFRRYKNPHLTCDEMEQKLTAALFSAALDKIQNMKGSVLMLPGIRQEFKCRVEGAMRTELYGADGDDFKLSALIEYQ